MGKGYKRKTRWRTLNIGAPPGEEDEEDGIRNGYTKGQENGMSSRNGQPGHKSGRTDSAGSTTSDYASDYASAASRSRRDDSGGSPSQPKVIFNEDEYTRITTPRQDVLFKKGYLSRKKVWASTASTSATPSTTESQSASHSTADGSETTEDQQLLDCKENGAEEYPAMVEPGAQVAYGTFYDHASGYYYEYPVMVMGPGGGMPGPPMHNVLTAVPCGPVPLRPIEWVNPAFVPKVGNQQYCVMDYQTAHLAQYPTLVDANGVPLPVPAESTNGIEEACHENGVENTSSWNDGVENTSSWTDVVDEEEQFAPTTDSLYGTAEDSFTPAAEGEEEATEELVNSENYLETALVQQLHVTHVAEPPVPQPYMYPGHYMFGPSLVNVNGVTIQCGPMVRNTGVTGGPTNTGASSKRRKKKKMSKRKSRRLLGPGYAEDEEQEEEDYSSEAENAAGLSQIAGVSEVGSSGVAAVDSSGGSSDVTTSTHWPLNPECQEFRPVVEPRIAAQSTEETSVETANDPANGEPSSSADSSDNNHRDLAAVSIDKSISQPSHSSIEVNNQDSTISRIPEASVVSTNVETTEKLVVSRSSQEPEAAPVEFAAEVFANVTNMAERALAPRNVVEGTPMETEIGVDATSVDFKKIEDNVTQQSEDTTRSRRRNTAADEDIVPNGQATMEEERLLEKTSTDGAPEMLSNNGEKSSSKRQRGSAINDQRGSRSASPGIINRTTTPINAMTQRLPESYESLVTKASNASSSPSSSTTTVTQSARNRKYSAKGPKFVREATPGPDLDALRIRNVNPENNSSGPIIFNAESTSCDNFANDHEAIATGVDAIEAEVQRYSVSSTGSFYTDSNGANKREDGNADTSNNDSGFESQTRFPSDHPITDAVTEWLQRANSPELFVTSTIFADSEPEDDELDDREPPKNLQGNPMPALSANSNVNDIESSRLASCGEFARDIKDVKSTEITINERNNNDEKMINGEIFGAARILRPKKKRLGKQRGTSVSAMKNDSSSGEQLLAEKISTSVINEDTPRERVDKNRQIVNNEIIVSDDFCEFTEKDSVVGMRVAKSSRTKTIIKDSRKSRVDKSCRSKSNDKSTVIMLSSRDVPVENVEVKVRRLNDDNDEGIVEDEEVSVRTFEKGEIVVSIEGKVLPVADYEPILLQHQQNDDRTKCSNDINEKPQYTKITCEQSRFDEDTSTASDNSVSKRNSLGSIEEPDVLECWEVETVEPITTPKRQARGTSLEGEAAEDDAEGQQIDPAAVEIVRKYYRLEAMRDSGASVTSVEDEEPSDEDGNTRKKSLLNSPERMIESLCSEEIPVIGERMSKIVEKMLNDAGIPVDEAVEVYESCYNGKPPSYLLGFDTKFRRNGTLYGQDPERENNAPCKAACCNIQ